MSLGARTVATFVRYRWACQTIFYFDTIASEPHLNSGHTQKEHKTSHGSMSKTRWAIDGPDGTAIELNGRKFAANDEGAPMLVRLILITFTACSLPCAQCSMVCRSLGRHVHVDFCRSDPANACNGPEHEHIQTVMQPEPTRTKDLITHDLFWRRSGESSASCC
jgi:hypothetical protein